MAEPPVLADLPARLRPLTNARVALGRAGAALPTRAVLDLALAHARARDAVHEALPTDFAATLGASAIEVRSLARDRLTYLQRPDLGRRLDRDDAAALAAHAGDLAIVVADGLSAIAVRSHAAPLIAALAARSGDWHRAPIVVARQARVALGDEIGAALGARAVVMLIGERPGLSAPDSLGAYITWAPRPGRLDSERNCVSNIRPPIGLGYDEAAARIAAILTAARRDRRTGVAIDGAIPDARLAPPIP